MVMSEHNLKDLLAGFNLDEIKETIFSLIEEYFPVMADDERQELILKLLGKSGDDKIPSMVNR
jgi:hypothetical protein